MMASQTEIINRAIVLLGEARIASPSDDVKAAREMSALWDTTRRALLRAHRWGFAMKRAELSAMTDTPAFQFDFVYLLPSDFLRLDMVGDEWPGASLTDYRTTDESVWAMASTTSGPAIESSLPAPLNIRYVADVTVTTHFDSLFVEALAAKLAVDAAQTLTGSESRRNSVRDALGVAISQAFAANAIERPPSPTPDDSWILARR